MSKYSKIDVTVYDSYMKMLKNGCSKAAACRALNISPSTMRDYIIRMRDRVVTEKPKKVLDVPSYKYAMVILPDRAAITLDNGESMFVSKNDNYFKVIEKLEELSTREQMNITETEWQSLLSIKVECESLVKNLSDKLKSDAVNLSLDRITKAIEDAREMGICNKLISNIDNTPNSEHKYKLLGSILMHIIDTYKSLSKYKRSNNRLKIESAISSIVTMLSVEEDTNKVINFAKRLISNPDIVNVDNLYEFLSNNKIEIDDEGMIIGYRAIRNDWKDKHSATMDNSVGQNPSVKREKVNTDRSSCNSYGLHVGSYDFAKGFACGNDRIIKVSVDPYDVVSVPEYGDYGKIRVCKFTVLQEMKSKV